MRATVMHKARDVRVKRIYEPAAADDGSGPARRILPSRIIGIP